MASQPNLSHVTHIILLCCKKSARMTAMKNVLILHGAGNSSQGNWFPWLKKELEQKGYKVWSPNLPNSDQPILRDWLETIASNKDWKFDSESILIGHSSGATFALRLLERLPEEIRIDKTILVATFVHKGTLPEFFPYKEGLLETPFVWGKIKNSSKSFHFIASDNDPYQCGVDNAKVLQDNLGGELILKSGEGHFNLEKGSNYKQFPLIVKLV